MLKRTTPVTTPGPCKFVEPTHAISIRIYGVLNFFMAVGHPRGTARPTPADVAKLDLLVPAVTEILTTHFAG